MFRYPLVLYVAILLEKWDVLSLWISLLKTTYIFRL